MNNTTFSSSLRNLNENVEKTLSKLQQENIVKRIWEKDYTVWDDKPDEISNRLGWLESPAFTLNALPEINEFVESVINEGFTHALLLGMGGSSLAPEVMRLTFGVKKGHLDLSVLDSTDPGTVLSYSAKLDPGKTLYIVSTKSGGTVETISFMKYFYNIAVHELGREEAGNHFTAITDPGSGLEAIAKELNFRKIFLNDPNIGGRYSALSFFGMVPAALIGVDLKKLIDRTSAILNSSKNIDITNNSPAELGVILGEAAEKGRDKATFIISEKLSYFGAWAEQLIAESTGKNGKGILPVDLENITEPGFYGCDRIFVNIKLKGDNTFDEKIDALKQAEHPVIEIQLEDEYDLGGEFLRWEFAVIIAGWRLGIQPFDQPNVESAKIAARTMVEEYHAKGSLPELTPLFSDDRIAVYGDVKASNAGYALVEFLERFNPGDKDCRGRSYAALQAFVKPDNAVTEAFQRLRNRIRNKYKLATTFGYGPRFLHSTGQLHKGDAGNGLFIQFTSEMPEDTPIPDNAGEDISAMSFGVLKDAQALGDRQALLDNNRQVIRFTISGDIIAGLEKLASAI